MKLHSFTYLGRLASRVQCFAQTATFQNETKHSESYETEVLKPSETKEAPHVAQDPSCTILQKMKTNLTESMIEKGRNEKDEATATPVHPLQPPGTSNSNQLKDEITASSAIKKKPTLMNHDNATTKITYQKMRDKKEQLASN